MCQALRQRGCPWSGRVLDAAAAGGHLDVCEWLLANGCPWSLSAPGAAAAGGHVGLTDRLLLAASPDHIKIAALIRGAAKGCDLATLQRLHEAWVERRAMARGEQSNAWSMGLSSILPAAVASPTPDWREKTEWLAARGFRPPVVTPVELFLREDWRSRLDWLRLQIYWPRFSYDLAYAAAAAGNRAGLESILPPIAWSRARIATMLRAAATQGHAHIFDLLANRGAFGNVGAERIFGALCGAVLGGHVPAAEWLAQRLGPALRPRLQKLARYAAGSGHLPMLRWLDGRGCRWGDVRAFAEAAGAGSEEQLEWPAERGCHMGNGGAPYVQPASRGDVSTLACLRRLGCPWGGRTFVLSCRDFAYEPFERYCPCPPGLAWLLEQGCPVDWAKVEEVERVHALAPGVVNWLLEVQQRSLAQQRQSLAQQQQSLAQQQRRLAQRQRTLAKLQQQRRPLQQQQEEKQQTAAKTPED